MRFKHSRVTIATDDDVLEYMAKYFATNHRPPALREIGQDLGYKSPSTIQARVDRLIAGGLVTRLNGPRGLVVTEAGEARLKGGANECV